MAPQNGTLEYDLGALRRQIVQYLNDTELRNLCFDLGIIYDILAGQGLEDKARELLQLLMRLGRIPELVAWCERERPNVSWQLMRPKAEVQTISEADVVLQAKVIEEQSRFFDDITRLVWQWRYLAIQVAYYGGQDDGRKFAVANKTYEDSVWELFNRIRTEISRSQRFVSRQAYESLLSFYELLVSVDKGLSTAMNLPSSPQKVANLRSLNDYLYGEVTVAIEKMIGDIAKELPLK